MKLSYAHWVILLFLITIVWGSSFALVKGSLADFGPFAFLSIRFIAAFLLLAFYILITKSKFDRSAIRPGIVLGIFLFLCFALQTIGLKTTSATNSAFITALYILFVPLLSMLMLRRLPTKTVALAVILAMLGLYLLTGASLSFKLGEVLTLLCAIACAFHIIYTAKYTSKSDTLSLVLVQFGLISLLSIASMFAFGETPHQFSPSALAPALFLAFFATVLAYFVQTEAQKVIEPTKVSFIFICESIFAVFFASVLLGEKLILAQGAGAALILLSILIAEFGKTRLNPKA
jgi:drug/metabolite transporter (DMT)-like permease